MKKLLILLGGLIVLIVIVLAVVAMYVDSIAKTAVQAGATSALGVKTTLKSMDIQLLARRCGLEGLSVNNPDGFDTPRFLGLGQGEIDVTLGKLLGDPVTIDTITLADIDVYLEKKGDRANYQVIIDNMKKSESQEPSDKPGKKFVIKQTTIRNVNAHLKMGGVMQTKEPIHIDHITLANLGSDTDGGVLLEQLSGVIVKIILQEIVRQGANLVPGLVNELGEQLAGLADVGELGVQVLESAGAELGKAAEQVGRATEKVGETVEQVSEKAKKEVDKIKEGLGGLLKPKNEKDK